MQLHDELIPVLNVVVARLLDVIPEHWRSATLVVRRVTGGSPSGATLDHIITSDAYPPSEFPLAHGALFEATGELARVFARHGQPWESAEIRVAWLAVDEKWESRVRYVYPKDAQPEEPPNKQ